MKNYLSKTKVNYLHNSRDNSPFRALVFVVLAFLVLIFGGGLIKSVVSLVTAPLYSTQNYFETSESTVPTYLRSRAELDAEIQHLTQVISSNEGINATLRLVMNENTELRALLGASTSARIGAGVIARPPFTPYDTIIIDKGSDDGIVERAPVYYGAGKVLGYVRSVFRDSAHVTLISSPGMESTVYVFGPNIFTTAHGEGGGTVRLSVPQGIKIERGNLVILPSIDTGVVGEISDIQSIPTEPEQHAYVAFETPLQSIRLVSVGTLPVTPRTYEAAQDEVLAAKEKLFFISLPITQGTTSTSSVDFALPHATTTR